MRRAPRRTDHRACDAALRIVQRSADGLREFAGLAAELPVADARAGGKLRHADGNEDFVGLQRGFEEAGEKFFDGKLAPSSGAGNEDGSAKDAERARPVGGRIGVGEAATDGASVAHRAVGNVRGHFAQEPGRGIRHAAVFDLRVRDAGTEGDAIAVFRKIL